MLPWIIQRTKPLIVPAHRSCGRVLWLTVLWRNMSLLVLATAGVALALWLEWSRWQALGLVTGLVAVPILWHVFCPVAFEFTFKGGRFVLSFRDHELAVKVAEMNEGVVEEDVNRCR